MQLKTQCNFSIARTLACELVPLWFRAFVDKLFHDISYADIDGTQSVVCDHVMIPDTNR